MDYTPIRPNQRHPQQIPSQCEIPQGVGLYHRHRYTFSNMGIRTHPYSNDGVPAFFTPISNNKNGGKNNSNNKKKLKVSSTMAGIEQQQQTIMTNACSIILLSKSFTPKSILEREDGAWFRDFRFGRITTVP